MVKHELFVTVPSLFRCPISLDVMKSPVSLCTGVTYDRSSIQHWLESGHDTCPATMQILSTKDFTPNLTLHRLINLWLSQLTLSDQDVRVLIQKIGSASESGKSCYDCLRKVVEFVSCSEENRSFLAGYGGFAEAITGVLNRKSVVETVVLELSFRVLNLILKENGVKEKLNHLFFKSDSNCLASFLKVLQTGSLDSKIESIKVLESILLDNESKRRVLEEESLLSVLFDQLKTAELTLSDAVLSILITVSGTRSVKALLIRLGLVQELSKILPDSTAPIPTVEKAIKLLSIITTCSEGRLAVSEDTRCVSGTVEKIMKVTKTAREDAVVVLWSMCCAYKDGRVKEAVVKSNGVTKVLLVMQSENEGIVRAMCGDLMKVLGRNCGLGSYDTKTTHIMPY